MRNVLRLDPETLIDAYCRGIFPMADPTGQIAWYTADPRGVIPLDESFHVPHTLGQFMRGNSFPYRVRINHDFEETMCACMLCRSGATWITEQLIEAYTRLHGMGLAHSVEAWRGERLVGGLYGVSIGGAFFGESMFHYERDASKVALVHLVEHCASAAISCSTRRPARRTCCTSAAPRSRRRST